jgi:hypothetical protein
LARNLREHQIENDGVVVVALQKPETLRAVGRGIHRVADLTESLTQGATQALGVLDDQDSQRFLSTRRGVLDRQHTFPWWAPNLKAR